MTPHAADGTPPTGDWSVLAQKYRDQVKAKLPRTTILPQAVLDQHPPGSDVSKVPETCQLLTDRQLDITRMDCTELLQRISEGHFTAYEVVLAYGNRASIAHQLTNCLTDFFLEDALVRARELDDYYRATGTTVGPLHGLPISAKDQVMLRGRITSMSFLSIHDQAQPADTDAQLVQILQKAGAVFYAHTTLCQTIMHLEGNSFWGRTVNGCNTSLSSGGSSCGEGALIGMHGSPLGLGTDIGGSIRIPAGNVGAYGFRATAQRIPNSLVATYYPGRETILGVVGPLTHSARDLELFMRVVCGTEAAPWNTDPVILELPWRGGDDRAMGEWQSGKRPLRLGVMWNDGQVRPLAPIERTLKDAVNRLSGQHNIELKEFAPFESREAWNLIRQLYFPDGGQRVHELLDQSTVGEPLDPLTTWLLEEAGPPVKALTTLELYALTAERDTFRRRFRAHWLAQEVDVVLMPNAPYPAPPHGRARWWNYTSFWNLVDAPAVTFPFGGRVDLNLDDVSYDDYQPLSEDDKYAHDGYHVSQYRNAPLALQLVGRRFHDEEVLDALKVIEAVLKP